MSLRQRIDEDLKVAMRARDQVRMDTLRGVKSAIKYKEVEGGEARALADDDILRVIAGLVKQRKDSAEQYRAGGRPELAEKEEREAGILEHYLPPQITPDELEALVAAAVQEAGASSPKEMGAVMKILLPRVAGRAEGRLVSEAVRKRLSGA